MKATAGKVTAIASSHTESRVDTIQFTLEQAQAWKAPPFQRALQVTPRVRLVADGISKNDGVLPGILTLGKCGNAVYLIDGQHRIKAAELAAEATGIKVFYADVRTLTFATVGAMGDEFVNLNSHVVALRPDDRLRAMEAANAPLRLVREKCPFVGYDMIRRSQSAPILSMSVTVRAWFGSLPEVPTSGGVAASQLVESFTTRDAEDLVRFLGAAHSAWGRDHEYQRLWGALNMTLCMWLFRRLVLNVGVTSTKRFVKNVSVADFQKALMTLSASESYIDWLHGRSLSERNRTPAYSRLKALMGKRLSSERGGARILMPQPSWSSSSGAR